MYQVLCSLFISKKAAKEIGRGVSTMKRTIQILLLSVVFVMPANKLVLGAPSDGDLMSAHEKRRQAAITEKTRKEEIQKLTDQISELKENLTDEVAKFKDGQWFHFGILNSNLEQFKESFEKSWKHPEDDDADSALKANHSEAKKAIQKIYPKRDELERLVKKLTEISSKDAPTLSSLFNEIGFADNGKIRVSLTIDISNDGKVDDNDFLDFDLKIETPERKTPVTQDTAPSPSATRAEVATSCHFPGYDDDEDDEKGKKDSGYKRSGVREAMSTIVPAVVATGAMVGWGYEAYRGREREKDLRHWARDEMNKGRSPYPVMQMAQGMLGNNSFRSLSDVLAASMFALQYDGSNGGKSYDPQAVWMQRQAYQELLAYRNQMMRQQGSGSSTSTQSIQLQRQIESLNRLPDLIRPDAIGEALKRGLQQARSEVFGGMSQRNIQDLMTSVTNATNALGQLNQFAQFTDQIGDQIDQALRQWQNGARNLQQNVNGQGGITQTFNRTRTDNWNNNFQSQSQGQGNMFTPGARLFRDASGRVFQAP